MAGRLLYLLGGLDERENSDEVLAWLGKYQRWVKIGNLMRARSSHAASQDIIGSLSIQ